MPSHSPKKKPDSSQSLLQHTASTASTSATYQFVDNRLETAQNRRQQAAMNNSAQVSQSKAFQRMVNARNQQAKPIQRIGPGELIPDSDAERETYRAQVNTSYVASPADKAILETPDAGGKHALSAALRHSSFVQLLLRLLPKEKRGFLDRLGGAQVMDTDAMVGRSDYMTAATRWDRIIAPENITVNYQDDMAIGGYVPADTLSGETAAAAGQVEAREAQVKAEMMPKILAANAILHHLVDPTILVRFPPPNITIMMEKRQRAYQEGRGVKIANGDSVSTIVHEIGHYLENMNPVLWEDATMFRRKRGAEAGNTDRAVENDPGMEAEGRMAGAYPVTGRYTSKIYEALGSTEVVSMTLEYMSTREKLENLLSNDPQQLGLILRRMQPNDPGLEAIFDRFHTFFPNSDADRQAIHRRDRGRERERVRAIRTRENRERFNFAGRDRLSDDLFEPLL
ncbi:MAG: hypothetical protein AAF587_02725 [Bacteroidota bacterium]